MNNNKLNAVSFVGSLLFRQKQFEDLLVCCVGIYSDMISQKLQMNKKEESIRDYFFSYLSDDDYRTKVVYLQNFHFEKEPQENIGYLDIKVKTLNPYKSTKAFYVIECKNLNCKNLKGDTGLNAEYVKNGICRFVTEYYSSYFNCNAMFGFLIEEVDVQKDVVDNVNLKLNVDFDKGNGTKVNANTIQKMQYENFANGYPYSYVSTHRCNSGKELTLYHLMFDFSNNIK